MIKITLVELTKCVLNILSKFFLQKNIKSNISYEDSKLKYSKTIQDIILYSFIKTYHRLVIKVDILSPRYFWCF